MQIGLTGFASLGWPGLLRLRAENALKPKSERTAVIMVWLPGGLSHVDSYDPKPDIGSEYRGPFKTISTKVPGTQLHRAAADAGEDRGQVHGAALDEPEGGRTSGGLDADVLRRLRRTRQAEAAPAGLDVRGALPAVQGGQAHQSAAELHRREPAASPEYTSPAYLGDAYAPFAVSDDPNRPNFQVPNIGLADEAETRRLSDRVALRKSLDKMERAFDREGELGALDEFEAQAMTLLTNPQTRDAFDLSKEDARTRDRYGRNRWGQQLLLARRLVEAGVEIVTSSLNGPLCGRVQQLGRSRGESAPV